MIRTLALLALATAAWAEEPLVPRFVEETATAGVEATYAGDWPWFVGGGVAAFDCSGDGFPDLAIAGGEDPASLWVNRSERGGALRFERAQAGIEIDRVTGLYPLDVDGDDVLDLVLLRAGETRLRRGLGGCRFEPEPASWAWEPPTTFATAFAATWEDGASWPTLAVGTYIDLEEEFFPWGSCTPNLLYRPQGEGFAPPVELAPSFCPLSMLFTDWDRSGTPALRVSNDREYYKGGQEQLWRLPPGEPPAPYVAEDGWRPLRIWGMGIAAADVTGDGRPDYALTSMADNKLQTLADPEAAPLRPDFADVAFPRGAIAQRPYVGGDVRPSTAWHAEFADANLDGRADLFIAKGNVDAMPDFAAQDPNNLLLQRPDGTFVEAGTEAGVASMETSRGATLADLNLDGLPDLVVTNRRTPVQVWRNATEGAGRWIAVALDAPPPNRDGIGAFVEVRTPAGVQVFEQTVGGGHAGGSLGWRTVGLGAAEEAEVRVVWPDGTEGPWDALPAGTFHLLSPRAPPAPWTPPR